MNEQGGVSDRNGELDFASKICTGVQSRIATGNIEARAGFDHQGDFIVAKFEAQSNARVGVVTDIHTIGFPPLTVIQRQINTVHKILQAITQTEIDITITQGPGDIAPQLILEPLDVLTLIFGDVIRIPGQSKTQAIIGCISGLQETTHVRALEVGVVTMSRMGPMSIGMASMIVPLMTVFVMTMLIMSMGFVVMLIMRLVLVLAPWTVTLVMVMTIMSVMIMMIVLGF